MQWKIACIVNSLRNYPQGGDGRRFEKVRIARCSLPAKQGKHTSDTKQGNFKGAMEEGSRKARSHRRGLIVVDCAADDVHVSITDEDTSAL